MRAYLVFCEDARRLKDIKPRAFKNQEKAIQYARECVLDYYFTPGATKFTAFGAVGIAKEDLVTHSRLTKALGADRVKCRTYHQINHIKIQTSSSIEYLDITDMSDEEKRKFLEFATRHKPMTIHATEV